MSVVRTNALGRALVVLLALCLASVSVSASSVLRQPLARVAHPSTLALEIVPRLPPPPKALHRPRSSLSSPFLNSPVLHSSDSFRLTLTAFGDVFHLHLRPNDHLIHPAARIRYYTTGPDGQQILERTTPLLRESIRAYWGEVVAPHHSATRMREDAAGLLPGNHSLNKSSITNRKEIGWARIIVHAQGDTARGISPVYEGAFEVQGVTYHIQTRSNYIRNRLELDPELVSDVGDPEAQLVIWRSTDSVPSTKEHTEGGCSHDTHTFNTNPWENSVLRKPAAPPAWYDPLGFMRSPDPWSNNSSSNTLTRRDDVQGGTSSNNFSSTIGQSTGCPSTAKVVYMGVAADCEYVSSYGSTQNATMQILNDWNTASALYKSTFNVSLGILHINVQDPSCPASAPTDAPWNVACNVTTVTLNDRLSLFSQWRGTQGDDGTGLWHLMSGCPTGTEVGVAWLGTLCQQATTGSAGSFVSGTAVSTRGITEWEVVSHEIGHNFGAIHDCQSTCGTSSSPVCCPLTSSSCNANDQYIMSPVTSSSQKIFSQCSIGNICSLMQQTVTGHVNNTCIVTPDPSITTISLNMCGNGIVEAGEDCDPGQGRNSTCCDAATCKFTSGAVCDPDSSTCCTDSCAFAPATQVCRPSANPTCDTTEMCTGTSADCPADTFAPNGKDCGSGLTCANGVCTSLDAQCAQVGASMNLTTACPKTDSSCRVSCQDPSNSNQCIQLQSQVLDGSSCGYGGTCQSGVCKAGSLLDTIKAWYSQNLQIAVPVTVVAGILIILVIWAIFMCIRRKCLQKPKSMEPAFVGTRGVRIPSFQGPSPMQQTQMAQRPPSQPFVVFNAPDVAAAAAATAGASTGGGRRASIPSTLRAGRRSSNLVGSLEDPFAGGPSEPVSSLRNQSWDAAYGRAPPAGSARMPPAVVVATSRTRPSSGGSTRAREPAFPAAVATAGGGGMNASMERRQSRMRDESKWVDPARWNGPAR